MATTVQMNVRIDPSLKEQGDRVLAQHGMSPSQAIRAFYNSLTGTKQQSERMFQAIGLSSENSDNDIEKATKMDSVRRIQQQISSLNDSLGIKSRISIFERITDKELLEEAIAEAYDEEDLV